MGHSAGHDIDPTFYRSPADAISAPPEQLAYVVAFDRAGQRPGRQQHLDPFRLRPLVHHDARKRLPSPSAHARPEYRHVSACHVSARLSLRLRQLSRSQRGQIPRQRP